MYISVEYKFSDQPTSNRIEHALLILLESLHVQGSIAAAAKHLGRSYRYVWGELKYWEEQLGTQLVVWGRSSGGAVLTEHAIEFLHAMSLAQKALEESVVTIKSSVLHNTLLLKSKNKRKTLNPPLNSRQ
jgi:putative molybdopterin biosynthesis protein